MLKSVSSSYLNLSSFLLLGWDPLILSTPIKSPLFFLLVSLYTNSSFSLQHQMSFKATLSKYVGSR
jgi:hypothetical protein